MSATQALGSKPASICDWDVAIICVSYNTAGQVVALAESLASVDDAHRLLLIVVDNSESEVEAALLRGVLAERDNCRIEIAESNLGYFGGAALGLRVLRNIGIQPEWIVVSNPDIKLCDRAILHKLRALYRDADDVGVLAPAIISPRSQSDQNPFLLRRPSRARMRFYGWLYSSYWRTIAYQAMHVVRNRIRRVVGRKAKQSAVPHARSVYAAHGSFLVFSRHYFDRGGDFDYPGFLFGEEIWVAEQVRRVGLEVRYSPTIFVEHTGHVATGVIKSRKMVDYEAGSIKQLVNEYF